VETLLVSTTRYFSLGDRGFLTDPDTEHGKLLNPHLISFNSLQETPCLALLGEPGIGKSWSLKGDVDAFLAQAHDVVALRLDLRSVGTEERLQRKLFEDPLFLDWVKGKHELYLFLDNGNCRLMADLAGQLTETTSAWARLVAPVAEWVMQQIASTTKTRRASPATRLTQNRKREVRGGKPQIIPKPSLKLPNVCGNCDNEIVRGSEKCKSCALEVTTPKLIKAASQGRIVSHTAQAEFKRSQTQLANQASRRAWSASDQPTRLTAEFYSEKIQPLVSALSGRALARHLKVSHGYAIEIRNGRVPHPRHWLTLTTLLKVSV
jgi:hypothetical protein